MPPSTSSLRRRAPALKRAVVLLLLLALAGCAMRPDTVQPHHDQTAGEVWGAQTVGQTFVAQEDGLSRIDLYLATYARQNAGPITFHLRDDPGSDHDLATVEFDAAGVQDNAYRTVRFPPQPGSQGNTYFFFLDAPAAGPGNAITVWASGRDAYHQGQAYVAGQPQPGDLTFRTFAEYGLAEIAGDVWRGLRGQAGTALATILLFLVPGAGLLSLGSWRSGARYRPSSIGGWESHAILAAGLSVALAPLIILHASVAGLTLGRSAVILLLLFLAALAGLPSLLDRLSPAPSTAGQLPRSAEPIPPSRIPALLLVAVTLISLGARLLAVQGLAAPMWGDSYHHTLIARLLADHGGLFRSWEPYAPLRSFTYHFGFHANVALFHWLAGTPVLPAVIIVGQVLNALAALALYPLVRRLGGSPWAGLSAVLIAGLLSPMPAGYVNWGRYTQLTGMVILPVAATLLIELITTADRRWSRLLLAGVAVAGLVLSHYLVTLLFAPLAVAYLLWWTATHRRPESGSRLPAIARAWLRASTAGLTAAVLVGPWILNLGRGSLPRVLAGRLSGSSAGYFQTAYNAVGDLFAYVPPWLFLLAAAGAAWGLWLRRPLAIVTCIWTGLLVLLANPNAVGLPGAGVVNNFTLVIALYLPLSMLAGDGVAHLIAPLAQRGRAAEVLIGGLILVVGLAGARLRLADLDYTYRLVAPADLQAMDWIREHTPEDATFLVDSFTSFGGHVVVGDDAGWWIPYLAGRRTMLPPATYGLETPADPDYPRQIEAFYQAVTAQPLDTPDAVELLRSYGVTHVYIGVAGGALLDPASLRQSPLYTLLYDAGGAMIFAIAP